MAQILRSAAPKATRRDRSGKKTPFFGASSVFKKLLLHISRANQRLALSELDDDQLKDIGVSRREAEREAKKWFGS